MKSTLIFGHFKTIAKLKASNKMEGHVPIVVTIDPPVEPPYECGFGCDFQLTSNGTEDILVS